MILVKTIGYKVVTSSVIKVENLGKQYKIGAATSYRLFRDKLADLTFAPFRAVSSVLKGKRLDQDCDEIPDDHIWAIRNASFNIEQGKVVGVIGRNGAGKSTLLKILSRITEPTEGRATIHGRVGSLLEIGTGFHPELTGRENIFLNGTILGMKRSEVVRKLDEIVAFAEVSKFLDTPVKHYSSGMYLRLAFSVAAHLETEILLVDEVLAVGDAVFQKKCLGKMSDVAQEGRTILFVSHNMGAIVQLCSECLLFQSGHLELFDTSTTTVQKYISLGMHDVADVSFSPESNPRSPMIFTRCWIGDKSAQPVSSVDVMHGFTIGMHILVRRQILGADIAVRIHNGLGQPIFTVAFSNTDNFEGILTAGDHVFHIPVPGLFLAPDTYSLTLVLHRLRTERYDFHDHVLAFRVEESGSNMWQHDQQQYGNVLANFPWNHQP